MPAYYATVFAAVFAALYAAHQVADHWVQTDHQAAHKGEPGWSGRITCAAHVTTYTITAVVALAALVIATGIHLNPTRIALALAVSALTHYIADRRTPLVKLAKLLPSTRNLVGIGACRPGHDDKPCLGTGAYALDQSWHIGWLFIAALIAGSGVA